MTIPTSEEFRKLSLENRRLELFYMLQTLLPLSEKADALEDSVSLLSQRLNCVESLGKYNKYKEINNYENDSMFKKILGFENPECSILDEKVPDPAVIKRSKEINR